MTDITPHRQYLDDVSREIQDLIYDGRGEKVVELLVAQRGLGKMQAAMEVARIWSRMNANFPDAVPDLSPGSAGPASSRKTILVWTFIIMLTLIGAVMTFFGARGLIRAHASKGWPTAPGKIMTSSVERHRSSSSSGSGKSGKSSTSYHIRIKYAFEVDGNPFTGTRVGYGDSIGRESSSYANKVVRRFPKGKKVTVYHLPGNPAECLLEPGIKSHAFILPGIGLLLFFIGGVLICAAVAVARDEREAAGQSAPGGSH